MPQPIVIAGAGIAGLACANTLHRAGKSVLVLEAADAVGGRVRTDVTTDGFRLDHGFQVLQSRYPEVQRFLNLPALDPRAFRSGAMIRLPDGSQTLLPDPFKAPAKIFEALRSPIGTFRDKLLLAKFTLETLCATPDQLLARPARSTADFLHSYGWSTRMIDIFFRPFFGGVFLDRNLETASNLFAFIFQQFVVGKAVLPALGMQRIPEQLAARLPKGSIRLNTPVRGIDANSVELADGTRIEASAVVLAVDGSAAASLLPSDASTPPHVPAWRKTTCTYFAAPQSTTPIDRLLYLNARPGSLAHNVCFPSSVCPGYAPAGQSLVSVSTHGQHGLAPDSLQKQLQEELADWFGSAARQWRPLKTYVIEHALPGYTAAEARTRHALRTGAVYRCGDYLGYPSLNAALATGRAAAQEILGG